MLRFCDGFDSYTSAADFEQKWRSIEFMTAPSLGSFGAWAWHATEGINGGGCAKHTGAAGDRLVTQPYRTSQSMIGKYRSMLWFKIATPPAARTRFLSYLNISSDTIRCDLDINTSGFLVQETYTQVGGTPIDLYTGSVNVCDNAWHCLERYIYFNRHNTTPNGALKIALDGVTLIDNSAINTMTNFFDYPAYFSVFSLGVDTWVDDVIQWDDAGSNPTAYADGSLMDDDAFELDGDWWFSMDHSSGVFVNSDINNFPETGQGDLYGWLGPKQITTLRPASNGASNGFGLVGAPSNFEAVDDVAHDGDTSYLVDDILGERELFNLADFPHALPVTAVALTFQFRMQDHGSIILQPEAYQAPDSVLGFRRRLYGRFTADDDPAAVNLVANSGPAFVNTTGWTAAANSAVSADAGYLKLDNLDATFPTARMHTTFAVEANKFYRLKLRRGPDALAGDMHATVRTLPEISGGNTIVSVASIKKNIDYTSAPFMVSYDGTLYIEIHHSNFNVLDENWIEWVEVVEQDLGNVYKMHQWALPTDPTSDVAWTQAGINSAQFGMRITL